MNRILEVCLAGLTLVAGLVAANDAAAQTLQKGISVVMVATKNAAPMPHADDADAWIVTVVRDGDLFFGTDQVTAAGLEEAMTRRPRNREQKLYIKADARAPFASVKSALGVARSGLFEEAVLLTSQPESPAPGIIVAPKGLEVQIVPLAKAGTTIVQISSSGEAPPTLRINNEAVSRSDLPGALKRILQGQSLKIVQVEAGDAVPFAAIVAVLDEALGDGAAVALPSFHSI
ncbi:MAG: ExbD/TolR family protein [Candidatus Sulfotelmatobacter sp.]